jgi:16S rRNA (uracil1498-N3)-methyltransferase
MRRFWLPASEFTPELITISDDVFHHIFSVCRQSVGSKFELVNSDSHKAYLVQVQEVAKKHALAKVLQTRDLPLPKKPWIYLNVCIPKFATLETIIEKSVELGVHTLRPLFSDYSFVSTADKVSDSKINRWNKIVQAATQQSGRGDLMQVTAPQKLDLLLQQKISPSDLHLFLYEGDAASTLRQQLSLVDKKSFSTVQLYIGSEGGFSRTEVQMFEKLKIPSLTVGEQILRVETACVSLCSILKYEFEV